MRTIEKVIQLCKDNNTPVSKLEQACGFSNGYVRKIKIGKGDLPLDRVQKVAEFFEVPVSYFTGKEEQTYYINPETARIAQEIHDNRELRGLFSAARDVKPEALIAVRDYLLYLKQKETEG